jgi:hypothetical protein
MMKRERLLLFYKKLADAPAASTAIEAFDQIAHVLDTVENAHAGADSRMLPPSGDFWYSVEGRSDLDLYRQTAHDTIIRDNGAILIRIRRTLEVQFEKAGLDGRKVDL